MKISDLKDYTVVTSAKSPLQSAQQPKREGLLKSLVKRPIESMLVKPAVRTGQAVARLGIEAFGSEETKRRADKALSKDIVAPGGFKIEGLKSGKSGYKQVAGEGLEAGADIASVALPGVGKATGVLGKASQAALSGGVVGAGAGAGSALQQDKKTSDVIKESGKGALIGGAVGGVASLAGSGLSAIGEQIKQLPERLIRSATGQSKKQLLAGKDVSKFVLENKKVGTAKSLIESSQANISKIDDYINKELKSVSVTKARVTTSSLLDDIVKDVNAQGGAITKAEARQIIDRLAPQAKGLLAKPSMSLVTANKLRQSIDRTVGDRGFLTSELPFNKDLLKSFTNALREEVKTKAPEGVRAAFNSYSKEITLRNALTEKFAGASRNQIISFSDLFGAIPGGLVGGVPGVFAGAAVKRTLQSTPVLTGGAVALDQVNKNLAPILSKLEPGLKTAILQAISSSLSPRESQ